MNMINKGYKLIKNIIPNDILDKFSLDIESLSKDLPNENIFRTNDNKIKQIQQLQNRLEFNILSDYLQSITSEGLIMNMQYFIKQPNYKPTAPHQDGVYFDDINANIWTFWIPLQDVTIENSCMCYYDWNGKKEFYKHEAIGTNVRNRTGKTGYSQYSDEIPLTDFIPIEMKRGDLLLHNQFSLHYSTTNQTIIPRIAITCIIKYKEEFLPFISK